jgi:hypothetical protein
MHSSRVLADHIGNPLADNSVNDYNAGRVGTSKVDRLSNVRDSQMLYPIRLMPFTLAVSGGEQPVGTGFLSFIAPCLSESYSVSA